VVVKAVELLETTAQLLASHFGDKYDLLPPPRPLTRMRP
jgi:hypothetical protein